MIDLNRTLVLIKGALLDPEATWRAYLPEADSWQKTAWLLTAPLIVVSALLGYLLGLVSSDASLFGIRPTIVSTLVNMVFGAIAACLVAFIVSSLAGAFGGKKSFAHGLAAASLAFVPGYLGQVLNWLPWIGGLIALVLFIYALVLFWRIIPIYLDVPHSKRVVHYVLTLVCTIVASIILGFVLRPIMGPDLPDYGSAAGIESSGSSSSGVGGVLGAAMRQAELMAEAEQDRYEPPSDGALDEDQVEEYIRVMDRASEIMQDKAKRLQELAERAEDDEMSVSDLGEAMSAATPMMGIGSIELEVVKTGGGNWAEHQWVRDSLRTAYLQKDIDDTVRHNYALYQKYEDELAPYITR